MDSPLTIWYCDVCGKPITDVGSGYVIWKTDSDAQLRDHSFKIIHQTQCDRSDHTQSAALRDFVGVNGLTKLLSMLSYGPMKDPVKCAGVRDIDEWVDFVRRVQTPHYEEARRKFHDPDVRDDLADSNEVYPYLQDSLINLIKRK